jgi:hypothetical protein
MFSQIDSLPGLDRKFPAAAVLAATGIAWPGYFGIGFSWD